MYKSSPVTVAPPAQAESGSKSKSVWFEKLSGGRRDALCLFCFPYAGGSAQVFRLWRKHFPAEVDLCLVHLPGRGTRFHERPFTRLKSLVHRLADHIHDALRAPFAFYGHSLGAMIGFELARELRHRDGIEPLHLFLSGRRAPHVVKSGPTLSNLPDGALIAELRKLNGTPQELLENSEIIELFLPVLRADFEIVDTYEHEPEAPFSCPVTVYGGVEDEDEPIEDLRAWKEHTRGEFRIRMFSGDHFFIHANKSFLDALRSDVSESARNLMKC